MSKRANITDQQVIAACFQFHQNHSTVSILDMQERKAPWQMLMEQTGCPEKVVYSAMERAESRGLIESGVSLRTAWPTEKGMELIKQKS